MTGTKVFYGWLVVAGLFIQYMALVGIIVYTLPLFYPLLIAEFGWTPSQVTMPATLSLFGGALLTPFVSPLFDKYSIRKFMLAGLVFVVAGLALYGAIESIAFMLLLYVMFTLGHVLSGQVAVMMIVSRWFRRRRGLAMGIVLTAPSVGGAFFPLVVQDAVAAGDWRSASLVLGACAAVMFGLPLLLLIRNRPEDLNLLQDGKGGLGEPGVEAASERQGPTLGGALRTPDFYLLAFATGGLWFSINGILQHQSIILTSELGVDAHRLPLAISMFFWGAIAGKIVFGWLADRLNKSLMMLSSVILLFLGLLYLRNYDGGTLYPYTICYGLGFGGTFTMIQLLIAEFYSGAHYGKILGVLTTVDVAAGALGIQALALLEQRLGGYIPVLDVLIALTVVIAVTVGLLYRIRKASPSTYPPCLARRS